MLVNFRIFHESARQELQIFCPKYSFAIAHEHAREISLFFVSLLAKKTTQISKCHNFLILSPIFCDLYIIGKLFESTL